LRRLLSIAMVGAALTAFAAGSANAVPLTYIFTGTASGTLDGLPFTDLDFTFTVRTDTETLGFYDALQYMNLEQTAPATIALAGHPTATVSDPIYVFGGYPGGTAGFGIRDVGGVFFFSAFPGDPLPELIDYHMDTPVGPFVGVVASWAEGGTLQTDLGVLVLSSFSATGTFQAVPEPALLPLLAGGLAAACAGRARRRASERSPSVP
jgi:hypothetical protein